MDAKHSRLKLGMVKKLGINQSTKFQTKFHSKMPNKELSGFLHRSGSLSWSITRQRLPKN